MLSKTLQRVITQLVFLSLFPLVGFAQPIDYIDITVKDSGGTPVLNAEVELVNSSFESFGLLNTDENGTVRYHSPTGGFDLNDGTYDVYFNKNGEFHTDTVIVNFSTASFDGISGDFFQSEEVMFINDPPFILDSLDIEVETPGGIKVQELYVDLYDDNGSFIDTCQTDQNGRCSIQTYLALTEGDYTLELLVNYLSTPPPGGAFIDTQYQFTISKANSSLSGVFYNQNELVTLDTSERAIKVLVYEPLNGDLQTPDLTKPVDSVNVNYYSFDDPNEYGYGATDVNGAAYLPIKTTSTGIYSIDIYSNDATGDFREIDVLPGTEDVEVIFVVQTTDSKIIINLEDSNGNPIEAALNQYSSSDTFINCFEVSYEEEFTETPLYFNGEMDIGESTKELAVIGNTEYECDVSKDGGTVFPRSTISVPPGGSSEVTLTALATDAAVTFRLIDPDTGQPITDQTFDISMWTSEENVEGDTLNHSAYQITDTGVVELDLVDGESYRGFIYRFDEGGDILALSIGEYVREQDFKVEQASDGLTVDITIPKLDAELTVCLRDANGDLVSQGFAFADSPSSGDTPPASGPDEPPVHSGDEDLTDYLHSDGELVNGCATFGIKANRYYLVNADPFFENPDDFENIILPAEELVKLEVGEKRTINLELVEPNYTLTITADPSSQFGDISFRNDVEFAGCMAERVDGVVSFTTLPEDKAFNLKLGVKNKKLPTSKQQAFSIICAIYLPSDTEGGIGESYFEQFEHTPKKNEDSATVSVLFNNPDPFYAPKDNNVQINSSNTIVVPGGTVGIPAGGIATEGQTTFTYQSPTVNPRGSKDYRMKLLLDYTPKNNGEKVEKTPKPIEICFFVTDQELEEEGVTFDDYVIGHLNDETNKFSFPSVTRTTETLDDGTVRRKICTSTNEFSIFGKIIDTIKKLKETLPQALRIGKPKSVKTKKGKKRGKKGTRNKFKVTFNYAEAEDSSTTRFLFRYGFTSKKKCNTTDPENLPKSVLVDGTSNFFVYGTKRQKVLCGAISVAGNGRFSENAYRGRSRKRK